MSHLSVDSVTKRFGGLVAVKDVSFSVDKNSITGLIGPNGAGKTTLFNCITGALAPSEGTVKFEGRDITGTSPHLVAQAGLIRTFQLARLFKRMTVLENVMVGCHTTGRAGTLACLLGTPAVLREEAKLKRKAKEILDFVGLADLTHAKADSIPFGQQRLLELARAMAAEPRVLLLDEPAAGLNSHESEVLAELIVNLQKEGLTIQVIEHNMQFIMSLCNTIIVLDHGGLIAQGTPGEIKRDQRVINAYLGKEYK